MIEPKPPPSAMPRISPSTPSRVLGLAAREDDDAPAVEGALHDVAHALGQRGDRDALLLVDLLRGFLLDVVGRRLHLDEVRAELRGDLRRVGARRRSRSRPPSRCRSRAGRTRPRPPRPTRLRLLGELADLPVHLVARGRAGVDREADRRAAEAQRVADAARDRRARVGAAEERVGVVELEDQRDVAGELGGARLEEAERRRVGVAAGVDRELEVVARVVAGRVRREAARAGRARSPGRPAGSRTCPCRRAGRGSGSARCW